VRGILGLNRDTLEVLPRLRYLVNTPESCSSAGSTIMSVKCGDHGLRPVRLLILALTIAAANLSDGRRLSAENFTHVVSFGDSLSDTGNLFDVTSNPVNQALLAILFPELDPPIPSSPYFQGRFSRRRAGSS